MKRIMAVCLVGLLCSTMTVKAQWVTFDPSNLAQSIVNTTRNVLQTTTTAENMVKNFQETVKIYEQGKRYYDALKAVNNLVKDARKVQQTVLLVGEISDIYVNSFDSHDMLYANESMAAPYGGIEHFEGKKCWQALYKDKTGECEFCPKKHLIDENGQPTKVYSWDYQRPFDKCWFRVFSAAFAWIDGQIAHVITSVDINHQKTIEEELRVAKEKAENLDRLKSAFLANMSHEIRTPLNAIVGFASLLVESDDKKERQDYVDIMQENTELLLQLISDILDLSKIEAGTLDFTMDHLDIKSFCEDIMRNYDIKEDKPVPVLLTPDLPQYYIYTDKKRLMQVITNFINNALKFTNEGQITLEYHYKKESNEIEFAVTDTGMGIAPDKVNQVFDRFVKLNSFSKGTGLGLSICRSIIEHLGGTIGVESEMGTGSRFWFTHPLHLNQREKTKEIVSK